MNLHLHPLQQEEGRSYILHIVNFIVLHLAVGNRWLSCIVATCKFMNTKTATASAAPTTTHPSQVFPKPSSLLLLRTVVNNTNYSDESLDKRIAKDCEDHASKIKISLTCFGLLKNNDFSAEDEECPGVLIGNQISLELAKWANFWAFENVSVIFALRHALTLLLPTSLTIFVNPVFIYA
ncbi:hypothetical protein GQX74_001363 [Glossina fuscipes]|nr:hypothetical protein GQX74_001363 [Glossina fuscipes]